MVYMGANVKTKLSVYHKRLLLTSLLLIIIFASLCVYTLIVNVEKSSLEKAIHVKNETELDNAINAVQKGGSVIIALDNDITLTNSPLLISDKKDITLTSNKTDGEFFKLIGAAGVSTININNDGVLKLEGITVTHLSDATGSGVTINEGSILILINGEISDNTNDIIGGGVNNRGTFMMHGGVISGNNANFSGGGVAVSYNGVFRMYGGKILGNTAMYGGGVSNGCTFKMFGGEISGNTASKDGGGVHSIYGVFNRFGGTIYDNKSVQGEDNVSPAETDGLSNTIVCAGIVSTVGVVVCLFLYFKFHKRNIHR